MAQRRNVAHRYTLLVECVCVRACVCVCVCVCVCGCRFITLLLTVRSCLWRGGGGKRRKKKECVGRRDVSARIYGLSAKPSFNRFTLFFVLFFLEGFIYIFCFWKKTLNQSINIYKWMHIVHTSVSAPIACKGTNAILESFAAWIYIFTDLLFFSSASLQTPSKMYIFLFFVFLLIY